MKTLFTLILLTFNCAIYSQEKPNQNELNNKAFNDLLQKYVTNSGEVNYKGFLYEKEKFDIYLNRLSNNIPNSSWSKNKQLAYWMNVYNAFTIELIINNYPTNSIKNIKNPWKKRFIKIGDEYKSLSDIEHRILRKMNDPRIHFGINCASYSCPPLYNNAFTEKTVQKTLDSLTCKFVNDSKRNSITKISIDISKIFQWFSNDFKKEETLIEFLNKYSIIQIEENAKITYKKYNWTLNE